MTRVARDRLSWLERGEVKVSAAIGVIAPSALEEREPRYTLMTLRAREERGRLRILRDIVTLVREAGA